MILYIFLGKPKIHLNQIKIKLKAFIILKNLKIDKSIIKFEIYIILIKKIIKINDLN